MADFDPDLDELLDRKCEAMMMDTDRTLNRHIDLMSAGHSEDAEYIAGLHGWAAEMLLSMGMRMVRNWLRAEIFRTLNIIKENGNGGNEEGDGEFHGERGDDPSTF